MSLRARLVELLADHGHRAGPRTTAALADFLAILRGEDDVADDEDDEDADDEVGDEDAADDGEAFATTRAIACPHCGERLEIAVDLTAGDQDAIQDCEVCCSPIRIVTTVRDGRVVGFHAEPA
jgi:hypothetical protein